ncbi:MAG: MerC domain-containing protein [Enhygromyxa sp.]
MATPHQTVDRVGGWLSLVCAIHCAVVPIAVLLAALGLPVLDAHGLFDDFRFELAFSLVAVVLVGISLGLGVRGGAERRPMVIGFSLGLVLIAGSHLTPGPEWLSHLVLVVGALTVAHTHRRSLKSRACCDQGEDDPATPASAPLLP